MIEDKLIWHNADDALPSLTQFENGVSKYSDPVLIVVNGEIAMDVFVCEGYKTKDRERTSFKSIVEGSDKTVHGNDVEYWAWLPMGVGEQ